MKTILIALMLIFTAAMAMADTVPTVTYHWTPPTTGSPVEYYVVQWKVNDLEWVNFVGTADTTITFENLFEYGETYIVRVAGVDAEVRQGGFSNSSIPYTPDAGAPGQPGAPIIIEM